MPHERLVSKLESRRWHGSLGFKGTSITFLILMIFRTKMYNHRIAWVEKDPNNHCEHTLLCAGSPAWAAQSLIQPG